MIRTFVYLNLLDILTTLVAFRFGYTEASPYLRAMALLMPSVAAMLSIKAAWLFAAYLLRPRVIGWTNVVCGTVVVWNLAVMLLTVA